MLPASLNPSPEALLRVPLLWRPHLTLTYIINNPHRRSWSLWAHSTSLLNSSIHQDFQTPLSCRLKQGPKHSLNPLKIRIRTVLKCCSLVCLEAVPHFDPSLDKTDHVFILNRQEVMKRTSLIRESNTCWWCLAQFLT